MATPVAFYLPAILGEGTGEGAAAAGAFLGGVLELSVRGFVVFAVVPAATGYAVNRRAKRQLAAD
ncbi:hypothetical protein [Halosolutus halophilus]|uniref:hypothetical protein n=1 Tax=Halosolutus halophilus TaxID=1552990 RepID=UPI0022350C06|nr:hypothetical protein [Halosolutus halophilus]